MIDLFMDLTIWEKVFIICFSLCGGLGGSFAVLGLALDFSWHEWPDDEAKRRMKK